MEMISFIVIGLNEEKNLANCFSSIFETIKVNNLQNYEVLFIDSNSTDNSLEVAKSYKQVKIYQLTHDCNAAIARNVGAELSIGEQLIFVDGDMCLQKEFFNFIFNNIEYKNAAIIGNVKLLSNHVAITKGPWWSMMITKNVWNEIGGMKNKYRRTQDTEFLFRLKRRNYKLIKIDQVMMSHSSLHYIYAKESLKKLFQGNNLYMGVFYREYFFSKQIWLSFILRNEYTALYLMVVAFLLSFHLLHPLFFLSYFLLLFVRILFKKNQSVLDFMYRYLYYFLRDINTYIGFFAFFPTNKKNIKFEKIQ